MKETFEETYAHVAATPEGEGYEIPEPGVIRAMGNPGDAHRGAFLGLIDLLMDRNRRRRTTGTWWIEPEAEVRFGDRMYVPDLSGWRVDRVPELPRQNPLTVIPDLAIEILSPATAIFDRNEKLPRYLAEGVGHVWLVDPVGRTVEVYAGEDGRLHRIAAAGGDETVAVPPFDAPIALGSLWAPPAATLGG